MDSSTEDLRLVAKNYCCTTQEWQDVCSMSKSKIKTYIAQKEFENAQNLRTSFFSGAHRAIAYAVDAITKGNGHVNSQIANDLTLQRALEEEAMPLLCYLNNRAKLAMLLINDIIQGKLLQRTLDPQIIIEQEENGDCQNTTELVGSNQGHGWTNPETEITPEEDLDIHGFD